MSSEIDNRIESNVRAYPEFLTAVSKDCSRDVLAFNYLRHMNVARCEAVFHALGDWSPTDWATVVAGEVGEACNVVKKLRRLDGGDQKLDTELYRQILRAKTGIELADVVIYADLLAARLGIDLGAAIRWKFNAVSDERGSVILL